jgi:hypothetical protein
MIVSRISEVASPSENDHCHAFVLYESKSLSSDLNQEKQHLVFSCDSDKDRDQWVLNLANEILQYRPRDRLLSKEIADLGFKEKSIPRRSSSKGDSIKAESSVGYSGMSQISDLVGEIKLPISKMKSENSDAKSNTVGKYFKSKSTDKPLPQTKRVFGNSLSEAVELSRISKNLPIPAVVYRCIEYLEHKKGIFFALN